MTDAAEGRSAKLTNPSDKLTVARWCVLVAILFDQGQGQPRLRSSVHHALYGGSITEGVNVWLERRARRLGAYGVRVHQGLDFQDEAGADLLPPAYFVTFGVGHFVAPVMIPVFAAKTDTRVRRHTRGGILKSGGVLRSVWPHPMTPLLWPPPEQLDWGDMAEFTRSFQTVRAADVTAEPHVPYSRPGQIWVRFA